jgi:uncharacterized SAM-binding protein YcdF (DUF218 family)
VTIPTVSSFIWVLKDNFHLLSVRQMLLGLGIGIALLYSRRTERWGRRWLLAMLFGYWVLATPLGSWLIAAPLMRERSRVATAADATGAHAVVVLGGGIVSRATDDMILDDLIASGLRVIEGVRVYRLLDDAVLIVSGGNSQRLVPPRPESGAMMRAALDLGVPRDRIVQEDRSLTTQEQVGEICRILASRHLDRFVLVTSPLHMRRSMALFRAAGMHPVASASPLRDDTDTWFWTIAPDRESLAVADGAIYEYVATAYYWLRGWLSRPVA